MPPQVWAANTPILGTPYHVQDITAAPVPPATTPPTAWVNGYYDIDFTKPGAQEYINSVVKVFADWGFDYLKVDGIGPTANGVPVYLDNIRAIDIAVQKAGRPMYVNLSASLDHDFAYWWERYTNGRRIDGDIECSLSDPACSAGSATGLANITEWAKVSLRFADLLPWQNDTGPHLGWNDFDSLEVGNGTNNAYPKSSPEFLLMSNISSPPPARTPLAGQPAFVDGLTNDERQTAVTLWSIGGSPLQLGDDLTLLDNFAIHLLTNDEVIEVDQSGRHGNVVYEGATPVYEQALCDGSHYVALFNTTTAFATVSVKWVDLGFSGNADVRDLWTHEDMGTSADGYTVNLNAHGSALLRIRPQSGGQSENSGHCGPVSR